MADELHQLLSPEKGLTITDCEHQLLYLPGRGGSLRIEKGDLLLPESVSRQCIREKRFVCQKMERCLGWDYIGKAVPVTDEDGSVIGSVGTVEVIESKSASEGFVLGRSPVFQSACEQARKVARYDVSVLILGETGTGKEVMARYIVSESYRREKPFLTINCASIPPSLFESEMFGYEEGSFTGANKKGREGYFEIARNGTIFLDEIGELDMSLQAKLLRVLETSRILRVGGGREITVDTRIIAATNRDLRQYVKEGRFRADLFFRLSSVIITLPSLRSRKEDLPLYIEKFLQEEGQALGKKDTRLDSRAMDMLLAYDYPGNIRELQNIIKRTLILCDESLIGPEHIEMQMFPDTVDGATERATPEASRVPRGGGRLAAAGLDFLSTEKLALQRALAACPNKSKTALALGISRDTLYRKIRKHGLL
jgi:transcriptional regulator with PAS, ATPase and Fis domain